MQNANQVLKVKQGKLTMRSSLAMNLSHTSVGMLTQSLKILCKNKLKLEDKGLDREWRVRFVRVLREDWAERRERVGALL